MRVLLLTTPHTYRAEAFRAAARKLGIEVVTAIDLPDELGQPREAALALDFRYPDRAVEHLVSYARDHPLTAILSVDDSASLIAAQASAALSLPHNSPQAAEARSLCFACERDHSYGRGAMGSSFAACQAG